MKQPHLPRRVRAAVRRGRLGELRRVHDPRHHAYVWIALLGVAAVALAVAGVDYRGSGQPLQGWIALGLATGYTLAVLLIIWRVVLRGRVVYLLEGGLVVSRPVETFPWDALESVSMAGLQRGRRGRTEWRFTVIAEDGRELVLGRELPDVAELGEVVVGEVAGRMLPVYRRAVEVGGAVSFGPFVVDRQGVSKDGDWIPWMSIQDVEIVNGLVHVRRSWDHDGGAGLAATVGAVPNAVAFAALCREVLGEADQLGDDLAQDANGFIARGRGRRSNNLGT